MMISETPNSVSRGIPRQHPNDHMDRLSVNLERFRLGGRGSVRFRWFSARGDQ